MTTIGSNFSTTSSILACIAFSVLNIIVLSVVVTRWARRRSGQRGELGASLAASESSLASQVQGFNNLNSKFSANHGKGIQIE